MLGLPDFLRRANNLIKDSTGRKPLPHLLKTDWVLEEQSSPVRDALELCVSNELAGMNQYLHEYLSASCEEAALLFGCIYFMEMEHLRTLYRLFRPWVTDLLSKETGCLQVKPGRTAEQIRLDIRQEEQTIASYERLIVLIDDDQIREVLSQVLDDERMHLYLLEQAFEAGFCPFVDWPGVLWYGRPDYLSSSA